MGRYYRGFAGAFKASVKAVAVWERSADPEVIVMSIQHAPVFPCESVPETPSEMKLLGIYPQRQAGRMLQRVKIRGGRLTADQWRAMADVAQNFTPDTPLHLTTRQELEIHNLSASQIPPVHRALAAAGLSSLGSAGDTPRNMTLCPGGGLEEGTVDLWDLAGKIAELLESAPGVYNLPRKFKISLSGCSGLCAQPFINDLSFVAVCRDGRWGLRVIGAGSLGAAPCTGIELYEWIDPGEALPLTLAAIEVFAAHGDRLNRSKARLRHVRQRLGDEPFANLLEGAFRLAKARCAWPAVRLEPPRDVFAAKRRLVFPDGDVTPAQALSLADLAGQDTLRVRMANNQCVMVYARREAELEAALAGQLPLAAAAREQAVVVSCPGTRWCSRALVSSTAIAGHIRAELGGRLSAAMTVCISGCPNGCGHSAVGDLGLTGAVKTVDGQRVEAFNLSAGGQMGRGPGLGRRVGRQLLADEVLATIASRLG